ncbi:hypothetical protein GCM10010470_55490 [Saccharopolyspora taberi]|uniref:DUF7848 domain-containing protein n=1 Tax=Saccharopolyspora taberi TaxID=60895 RepID=A0ABN3VK28_9PSEU
MADTQLTDPPEQTDLFPHLQPEQPELPPWARHGRVSLVGHILTLPDLSQAPADSPHATWLRIDCLECGQYSEWVYAAEDGNAWDLRHAAHTGHRHFFSFSMSRIRFEVSEADTRTAAFL